MKDRTEGGATRRPLFLLLSFILAAGLVFPQGAAKSPASKAAKRGTAKAAVKSGASKTGKPATAGPARKAGVAAKSGTTRKAPAKGLAAHGRAAKTGTLRRGAAASKTGKRSAVSSRRKAPTAPVRRTQMQPTPERYSAIQQALSDRGYFTGPPTGIWGEDSVKALRRFQQDRSLTVTGKVDSLSLIALGLGPKYAPPAAAAKPAQ